MPDIRADEILTQKHKRAYIQYGGARPNNPVAYQGQDAQYMSIDGVSVPELGGIDPIWVPDPRRVGKYKLVGRRYSPADLVTATLNIREKHGSIPRQLLSGCTFNLYETSGICGNLMDFVGGWSDYVMLYTGAVVTEKDLGTRTAFDSDEEIVDGLSLVLSSAYPVGSLAFGEGASAQIDREAIDIVFGTPNGCDDCDNGDKRLYAIIATSGAGSPGLPPELVYSVDGGQTWAQANVNTAGAAEALYAVDVVGNYLVVIGADAYHIAEINASTGVPGTFSKITAGFVASKSPRDIYVAGPREVYFVGLGGYVYKSVDITAGVTVLNAGSATTANLNRVKGRGDTIVAVGASGTVIRSVNRGVTWASVTTAPAGTLNIKAVEVLDKDRYWVGTDFAAHLYYTLNGGESWTEQSFEGTNTGSIEDIVFATDEVGYFVHTTSTPTARLFTTWDGGADWTRRANRIINWPTFNRANRIAIPATEDPGYSANAIAVAGLAGNGVDGIVLMGYAARQ